MSVGSPGKIPYDGDIHPARRCFKLTIAGQSLYLENTAQEDQGISYVFVSGHSLHHKLPRTREELSETRQANLGGSGSQGGLDLQLPLPLQWWSPLPLLGWAALWHHTHVWAHVLPPHGFVICPSRACPLISESVQSSSFQ